MDTCVIQVDYLAQIKKEKITVGAISPPNTIIADMNDAPVR